MIKGSILFITNGDSRTGFGHISRSLTIADEFSKQDYGVRFLVLDSCPFKEKIILSNKELHSTESFEYNAKKNLNDIILGADVKIIVIDLVEKEYDKLNWLRIDYPDLLIVSITLFLFDLKKRYEHLSFFPEFKETTYKIIDNPYGKLKLFSGDSYFVFREEFKNIKKEQKKEAKNILISMGGSDPCNFTLQVLRSIVKPEITITVILSPIAPGYNEVYKIAKGNSNIHLVQTTNNMAKEMCEHDIIILNGGLTRYEACLAFTPFIAISIHEVQFNLTKKLTDLGVGINLGIGENLTDEEIREGVFSLLGDYDLRKDMADNMQGILSFEGARNIFNEIILNQLAI